MINKGTDTFRGGENEKRSEKSTSSITKPSPKRQNPFGLTVSIWVFIGTVIATLAGVSVGVIPYLLFPSTLTQVLAVIASILAFVSIPIYIAEKQEQRQERERQIAIKRLREREKDFFDGVDRRISAFLQEVGRRGKPTQ
jgi:putative Ca2+/H+ antiporter (TMEM165/GDT1 family)